MNEIYAVGSTITSTGFLYVPVNSTLSNLQVYISSNGRSTTTNYNSRVNAGAGAQTVAVTASSTGLFEDTTHTDSPTAGQSFCVQRVTGTGSGAIATTLAGYKVVTDGAGFPIFHYDSSASVSSTSYVPAAGGGALTATETDIDFTMPFAVTANKAYVYVAANTSSANAAFKSRIGAADGNINATITSSTTGVFSDTSNSDTISAGGLFNFSISGVTVGTLTPTATSIFLTQTVAGSGKLYLGSTQIKQLYIGATQIKKAYLGSTVVYSD
jgi:hypothetical protein